MMSKTGFKLPLDEKFCNEIYNFKDNHPSYKRALEKFQNALATNNQSEIDSAVSFLEAVISDIIYKKAFQDGMRFTLNLIAGEEVIDL